MPEPLPDLPSSSREALSKAALLEDPFPIQALLATGSPADALDPLFDIGLLEEHGPTEACFASETHREEALHTLSWSQKRKLSHTLAETCKALAQDPALVARLYLQAHQHAAAREQFLRAAEAACHRHDYHGALSLTKGAFEIWPVDEAPDQRRQALAEMARCARNCSDHATVREALEQLSILAETDCDPAGRIDILRQLAQATAATGDRLRARQLLAEAARFADRSGLATEAAHLRRSLAQAQGDALRLRDALATLETVRSAAESLGDWPLLSDSIAYAAMLTAMLGRISEANQLLQQALAIAIEKDLPDQITNAYRRQANVNEYASNYTAYRDTELAALDRCRSLGQRHGAQACLSCVSYAFFRLGQYDESLKAIEEAIDELKIDGELLAAALAVRACIHAFRGAGADPLGELDEAWRLSRIHSSRVFEFYLLWARGAYAIMDQQPDLARKSFQELIATWQETDDRKDVAPGLLCAASFFSQENDRASLARCVDILNTVQAASESAEPRLAFLAACAEDAWTNGHSEKAIERLQEAIAGFRELRLPFEEAWALWRLGFIQCQAGFRAESDASWKAAEATGQRLGLKPLCRAISRDRRQSEAHAGEPSPLTSRQREIARLIAAGRTNKEAAAELQISPRTVEMHVAALIDRLGCRSRTEAATKASELGLLR